MRVALTGGGTAGSVTPLLSIYFTLREKNPATKGIFIGTRRGHPERALVRPYSSLRFHGIWCGKFRRYISVRNIIDILLIAVGFVQALFLLLIHRVEVVVAAGGYVSVPVVWAAWVCRKCVHLHQQDVRPSLSNRLTAWCAHSISVTFESSLADFDTSKTTLTGNPVRPDIHRGSRQSMVDRYELDSEKPILLVTGGGTGSRQINELVKNSLDMLSSDIQVIHLTGEGKGVSREQRGRYVSLPFAEAEMPDCLAASDIIVSRAGLASLSEYSELSKTVICIPLPGTHQEVNADLLERARAALVLRGHSIQPQDLAEAVRRLLQDKALRATLQKNMHGIMKHHAATSVADIILP